MALESLYIRVTNATTGSILLDDVDFGLGREGAYRVRRPGPVYVPASSSVELALSSDVLLSYEVGAIRKQVDAGNLSVSQIGGAVQVHTWVYDYAVDGATAAVYELTGIDAASKAVPICLMLRGWIEVVTAPTSAGTPTLLLGRDTDPNGMVTLVADMTAWSAGDIIPFNGAEVSNGLIDVAVTTQLAAVSTKQDQTNEPLVFTLAAATLTAGKFNVHLEILPVFA